MKNHKKKVCLIVDNPSRDLDGLILLGHHLAGPNIDIYLVPMYFQNLEIPAICPDMVVVNFLRKENLELVKSYSNAGIQVVVIDTEGGIWESEMQFIKSIQHKDNEKYISKYLFWGAAQMDAFLLTTQWPRHKTAVTGCQRYDLYHSKYQKTLFNNESPHKNCLVFISNFGLGYPRYARSPEVEIQNMMNSGYDEEYCRKRVVHDVESHENFIKIISQLAIDFPKEIIVLRCHPFEDEKDYQLKLSSFSNVFIQREGVVANLLVDAKLIFHLNSTVAVDACLLGKYPYNLGWISTEITKGISSIPNKISKEISSYKDMVALINSNVVDQQFKLPIEIERNFYKCDGLNSKRISSEILALLEKASAPNELICKQYLIYGTTFSILHMTEALLRKVLGAENYIYLRTNYLVKNPFRNKKRDKLFSSSRVKDLLRKINECLESNDSKLIECKIPKENVSLDNRGIGASMRLSTKLT